MSSGAAIILELEAQGLKIRELKAAKVDKATLKPEVRVLLFLQIEILSPPLLHVLWCGRLCAVPPSRA
jgi:hypothetical protein